MKIFDKQTNQEVNHLTISDAFAYMAESSESGTLEALKEKIDAQKQLLCALTQVLADKNTLDAEALNSIRPGFGEYFFKEDSQ